MRMVLAVAACGVFFFSLLWAGNKVFATDSLAGATPARTTFPTTSAEDDTAASPREKSGPRKKSGRFPHDPRVHHLRADMVSARKAVLHASDIEEEWEPAALLKDGPPCRQNNPDLSRFTITGEARTIFKSPAGVARTESRVRLFANEGQAALYFKALNNRAKLRCIRDGTKRWLRGNGWKPRLVYARLETDPPIGTQTAMYLVNYAITLSTGEKLEYPVEVFTFQVHRAVGTLQYDFIFSPDGLKPCQCELGEANLVASRLYRTWSPLDDGSGWSYRGSARTDRRYPLHRPFDPLVHPHDRIYGFYWVYKTHEEIKRYSGNGIGGVLGLVIYILISPVTFFVIPSEVRYMYEDLDGGQSPVRGIHGLWILLPLIGPIIWFVQVQGALNRYWESKGAPPA